VRPPRTRARAHVPSGEHRARTHDRSGQEVGRGGRQGRGASLDAVGRGGGGGQRRRGISRVLAHLAPGALTTSLLSIVESPAYGNLTTPFPSGHFNADTPDDPRVRYFSAAARAPSANVWYPLWLPKLVLDSAAKRARAAAAAAGDPRAADDAEWGNDGLVSVQSARWGEFLGTVKGADHWEVRGARALDLDLDLAGLQAVSLAIPTPSLPEWDWSRWLGAWRRRGAAKQAQDAAAASQDGSAPAPAKDGRNDGGEKLSAFFDWVAEQVPADPLARVSARVTGGAGGTTPADVEAAAQGTKGAGERNELATKDDVAPTSRSTASCTTRGCRARNTTGGNLRVCGERRSFMFSVRNSPYIRARRFHEHGTTEPWLRRDSLESERTERVALRPSAISAAGQGWEVQRYTSTFTSG
jgi:hypothetical protein